MPSISEIYDIVKGLPRALGKVPQAVVKAMKRGAGSIVNVVEPVAKTLPTLKEPFQYSADVIHYVAKQGSAAHGDSDRFRKQLTTFVAGLGQCVTETNKLVAAVGNLPKVGARLDFASELATDVLNRTPDLALFPVAKVLAGQSGWETHPAKVASLIVKVAQLVSSKSPEDQRAVDVIFLEILTTLKMINTLIAAVSRLLPRDLSAGLALVGEGGSLTLTGHPVAWVFVVTNVAIDEVHTLLSAIQQSIKLHR